MLEAGEDPLFIARRLVRAASEDIGMADPQALVVAMAAQQAVHFIGVPEGNWRWRKRQFIWPPPLRAIPSIRLIPVSSMK